MSLKQSPIFLPLLPEADLDGEMESYSFNTFRLDREERQLFNGDNRVALTPKAFDVLAYLVERSGHLVTRDELMSAFWADSFVEEANLSRVVHTLRKALGDDGNGNKFIETVTKSGYRFVVPAVRTDHSSVSAADTNPGSRHVQVGLSCAEAEYSLERARAHRREGRFDDARADAEICLEKFRETGDRPKMAEAYREIGLCFLREGSPVRSFEYAETALAVIGDAELPVLAGKIYIDMAGASWALRKHKAGIVALEQAVQCFLRTELLPNLVISYNNLGYLLILTGDWKRAEIELNKGIEIALRTDDPHAPKIIDSRAELLIRRGDCAEAYAILRETIDHAVSCGNEENALQAKRNLARCFVTMGRGVDAYRQAVETAELCIQHNDQRNFLLVLLVLAESCLLRGGLGECDKYLKEIEKHGMGLDFFVLGEAQRIRGLAALEIDDIESAIGHFRRSRKIFEKDGDVFYTALIDFLMGRSLRSSEFCTSARLIERAAEVFKRLSVDHLYDSATLALSELGAVSSPHHDRLENSPTSP